MSNYESDDAYPHSPGLKAVRVKATPSPLPPPFIPQQITITSPKNVSPHSLKKRKKPNRRNTRPSQGDTVLINFMDPNRPDIARLVGERALNSDSGSEADNEEREERESEPATSDSTLQAGPNLASLDLVGTAQTALQEGVKTWTQLKEWVNRSPALAPNIDTGELLLPQAMHAQDLLLQQQNMNGQRIPPQSNNAGAAPNAQPGGQAPQARMVSQTVPPTQMQARSGLQMLQGMQHGSLRKRNAQFHISPETSPIDVLIQTSINDNEIRQRQQRKHLRNERVTHDSRQRKKYYQAQAEGSKSLQRSLQFVSRRLERLEHTKPPRSSKFYITDTISQDTAKDEKAYMKSRLYAIQDRPLMLAARNTVL